MSADLLTGEQVLDVAEKLNPCDEVEVANSSNEYANPLEVADVDIVSWRAPDGECWRTGRLTLVTSRGEVTVEAVDDCRAHQHYATTRMRLRRFELSECGKPTPAVVGWGEGTNAVRDLTEIEVLITRFSGRVAYHKPDPEDPTSFNCNGQTSDGRPATLLDVIQRGLKPCQRQGCYGDEAQAATGPTGPQLSSTLARMDPEDLGLSPIGERRPLKSDGGTDQ